MLTEASHRRSTQNYCCKSFRKVYRENASLHACVRVDTCVVTFCKKDCRAGVLLSVWWHFTRSACYENASYWPLPVFTKIVIINYAFFSSVIRALQVLGQCTWKFTKKYTGAWMMPKIALTLCILIERYLHRRSTYRGKHILE